MAHKAALVLVYILAQAQVYKQALALAYILALALVYKRALAQVPVCKQAAALALERKQAQALAAQ